MKWDIVYFWLPTPFNCFHPDSCHDVSAFSFDHEWTFNEWNHAATESWSYNGESVIHSWGLSGAHNHSDKYYIACSWTQLFLYSNSPVVSKKEQGSPSTIHAIPSLQYINDRTVRYGPSNSWTYQRCLATVKSLDVIMHRWSQFLLHRSLFPQWSGNLRWIRFARSIQLRKVRKQIHEKTRLELIISIFRQDAGTCGFDRSRLHWYGGESVQFGSFHHPRVVNTQWFLPYKEILVRLPQ